MLRIPWIVIAAVTWLAPALAAAATRNLSLDDAVALARERAPAVLAARLMVDEARARSRSTTTFLHANPEVEAGIGRRHTANGDLRDLEFGVSQAIELGGRRGARIAAGKAGVLHAAAESDNVQREIRRDVSIAFVRGLHAGERLALARQTAALSADLLRVVERRHSQGDVAILDVNLAHVALSRARADVHTATAAQLAAVEELHARLDLPPADSLVLVGSLHDRQALDPHQIQPAMRDRPDLRMLDAERQVGEADHRLGRGLLWPELSLGSRYERDAGDEVVFGTATISVPLFDRGQGIRADASTRVRRLQLEFEAATRAAEIEFRADNAVLAEHLAAVEALETEALPLLDENDTLARRSYEAGQIALTDLLLIRREALETRATYLDRLLDAAIARIELESTAGVR